MIGHGLLDSGWHRAPESIQCTPYSLLQLTRFPRITLGFAEVKTQRTAQNTHDLARLPGTAAAVEPVEIQEREVEGTVEVTYGVQER